MLNAPRKQLKATAGSGSIYPEEHNFVGFSGYQDLNFYIFELNKQLISDNPFAGLLVKKAKSVQIMLQTDSSRTDIHPTTPYHRNYT